MEKDYLIKKWLNNELTETEAAQFKLMEDAGFFEEILEEAKRFKGDDQEKVASFASLDQKLVEHKKKSSNWIKIVSSMAAVFLVAVSIYTFLDQDQINRYTTEAGQNETVKLPDNSIVALNESSNLEYNSTQWVDHRMLQLQGEGYFDVEKGKRFEVTTEFGKVSVLGTEFNILSRAGLFEVSCYEGLVSVLYNKEEIKLPAGRQLKFISGEVVTIEIVTSAPVWLHKSSVFENALLQDVFMELGKQYHVEIQFDAVGNERFTGAFEHDHLENALKSITQPFNLRYQLINDRQVLIVNDKE